MKDAEGIMLREIWKNKGDCDCPHTALSPERSFAGVTTGSYICTTCGAQTSAQGAQATILMPAQVRQRLIERRKVPHFLVHGGLASFHAVNGSHEPVEGDAILLNVSLLGCRFETDQVLDDEHLSNLILHIPPHGRLIGVGKAMTRWHQGRVYGIKFLESLPGCDRELKEAISKLSRSK
jgi:hypothetical protein